MSLLLETTLGDLVIDLDLDGSPELCRNILKLAKARYYTSTLIYHVQIHRFCQLGDPRGDGSGGACCQSLLEAALDNNHNSSASLLQEELTLETSPHRFLQSRGRHLTPSECQEKGRVVATELNGIPHTVGSQFLITLDQGPDRALDGYHYPVTKSNATVASDHSPQFLSLGQVVEDDDKVLDQIHAAYCDADGRPYADIRIHRALVIYDPFDDPVGMDHLLQQRGVIYYGDEDDNKKAVMASPNYERPAEERVPKRILASQIITNTKDEDDDDGSDGRGEDPTLIRAQEEEIAKQEATSRAVVLEVLGDLPSADIKAPENVLFVCKLNPVTEDEDLELIFSRFDPNVKAEIIRDADSGQSLQYAFVEFSTPQQCAQAYFKMNNALVDDRRIKVDFSQSVSKLWDKYNQRMRKPPPPPTTTTKPSQARGPPQSQNVSRQYHRNNNDAGTFRNKDGDFRHNYRQPNSQQQQQHQQQQRHQQHSKRNDVPANAPPMDEFGRRRDWDARDRDRREERPSSSRNRRGERPSSSRDRRGERPSSPRDRRGERPSSPRDRRGERPSPIDRDPRPLFSRDQLVRPSSSRDRDPRGEDARGVGNTRGGDARAVGDTLGGKDQSFDSNHKRQRDYLDDSKRRFHRGNDDDDRPEENGQRHRSSRDGSRSRSGTEPKHRTLSRRHDSDGDGSRRRKSRHRRDRDDSRRRSDDSKKGDSDRDKGRPGRSHDHEGHDDENGDKRRHRKRASDDDDGDRRHRKKDSNDDDDGEKRHRKKDRSDDNDDDGRRHRKKDTSDDDDNSKRRHRKRSKDDDDESSSRRLHKHDRDRKDDEKQHRKRRSKRDEEDDSDRERRKQHHRDDDDDGDNVKRKHREDSDGRRRHHKHHRRNDDEVDDKSSIKKGRQSRREEEIIKELR